MRRLALLAAPAALALTLTGCALTGPPNVVGTWTGNYSYPSSSKTGKPSVEVLVITQQDGHLLWGYEEWQDSGKTMRADLIGSIGDDNRSFTVAHEGGWFSGSVYGNSMHLRYTRVDSHPTSFEVDVTKS